MCRIAFLIACLSIVDFVGSIGVAAAQNTEEATVQTAAAVLNETMATPGHRIPEAMLTDAYGVAIIPNVIKGGFVVGARHGRGLLFVREPEGVWRAPVFITLTGGNIGWQIGIQASDIILVLKTQRSVNGLLSGQLTLGADAAAAAGPVGRQTAMATDGQLKAEIYTYSRSRGLFAGVSIDGSVVRVDQLATAAYYRSPFPGQADVVPASALQLTQTIASYVGAVAEPVTTFETAVPIPSTAPIGSPDPAARVQNPSIAQQHRAADANVLQRQLTQTAPQLYELLDPQWKSYLALPPSLFLEGGHPSTDELAIAVQRFDSVASNPEFQSLGSRPEFQTVYGLLKQYQQTFVAAGSTLQLPPPPPHNRLIPR